MSTAVKLKSGAWSATVYPEIGGALGSLEHDGTPLMREITPEAIDARNVRLSSSYPLVPYSNRIGHGRFSFEGADYTLRLNFDNQTNAIHGVGWQSRWRIDRAEAASAVLSLAHRPQGEVADLWPFAFDAHQTFELTSNGLAITLCVRNMDQRNMPAGIGFHPYFVRSPKTTLAFDAEGVWLSGADKLPAERSRAAEWDYSKPRIVVERPLDHAFFGWKGFARMSDATLGKAITLRADPVFRHVVVYAPSDRSFVAVEPVSNMTDAVNRMNEPDQGLKVLAPGEQLRRTVHFGVEGL
jgi:aldose 1-epimerase